MPAAVIVEPNAFIGTYDIGGVGRYSGYNELDLAPGDYQSSWYGTGLSSATGVQIIDLPSGLSGYKMNVFGATPTFAIDATGNPQPTEIELVTNNGETFTFLLSKYVAEPPVIQVEIDIKPDSDENTINVGSNGTIAVSILNTDDFDVTTVDTSSVVFAGARCG